MAVRFTSNNNYYELTGTLPSLTAFTVMMWAYISVDREDYSACFTLKGGTGGDLNAQIATRADGTTWSIGSDNGNSAGYGTFVGEWHHLAWIRRSATDNEFWVDGLLRDDDFSLDASTDATSLYLGNWDTGTTYGFNGRLAAVKFWEDGLSPAEIPPEVYSVVPHRTANLWDWWPLYGTSNIKGVLGHDWVSYGTVTTEDGPPIFWSEHPLVVGRINEGPTEWEGSLTVPAVAGFAGGAQLDVFSRRIVI